MKTEVTKHEIIVTSFIQDAEPIVNYFALEESTIVLYIHEQNIIAKVRYLFKKVIDSIYREYGIVLRYFV